MAIKARDLNYYIEKYGEVKGNEAYARNRRKALSKAKGIGIQKSNYTEDDIIAGNAIRCEACGMITTRLQWTHFKNKCNVKTSDEYKRLYPNAPLVAPNLCNLMGVTKERVAKLYGDEEGNKRWDKYRSLQADSNSFEYKRDKHGWTREQFDEYNASRSVTLENMIKRHGEVEGTKRWDEYCEKQSYTCSLEYFINEYGETEGREKYLNWRDKLLFVSGSSYIEKQVYDILIQNGFELIHQFKLYDDNHTYTFDYADEKRKKIIEFHGDYWHANPKKYKPNDFLSSSGMTAKELWERDAYRTGVAESHGYQVYTIWEDSWKTDPSSVINSLRSWYENRI